MDRSPDRDGPGKIARSPRDEKLRRDALDIFMAGVKAADPYNAVRASVLRDGDTLIIKTPAADEIVKLPKGGGRVFVVGAGKGTAPMALALEEILGESLAGGAVCVKDGHGLPLSRVKVLEASHPLPDERSIKGAREILSITEEAGEGDLVIGALSGGGSALLTLPSEGVTLADVQEVTKALLGCGASIGEINALRKHLSRVKGGRLALSAYPAKVVNLALSDVVGDKLDVIASGPFSADSSTFEEAWGVVEGYGIADELPDSVKDLFKRGLAGEIEDTPGPGDVRVSSVIHAVVGSNRRSIEVAGAKARELGYTPLILGSTFEGEAREVARFLASMATECRRYGDPLPPPVSFLMGGETTVTIKGSGKGGRNQEMAMAFAGHVDGLEGVAMISGGTDGTDGPTDAAGGLVDGSTLKLSRHLGLDFDDYLGNNDSYHFLDDLGCLVKTGPTRTNVMDIQVVIVAPNLEN